MSISKIAQLLSLEEVTSQLEEARESQSRLPIWESNSTSALLVLAERINERKHLAAGSALALLITKFINNDCLSDVNDICVPIFLYLQNLIDLSQSESNKAKFVLWENVYDMLLNIIEKKPEELASFSVNIMSDLLKSIFDNESMMYLKHIRIKVLNSISEIINNGQKVAFHIANFSLVANLPSLLNQLGDYEMQSGVVEMIFRLTTSQERNVKASVWFENLDCYAQALFIRIKDFEPDCRKFLNAYNASLNDERQVYSLACIEGSLGDYIFTKPKIESYENLWVDFNYGSFNISILYEMTDNLDLQEERVLHVLVIHNDEVEKASVDNKGDVCIVQLQLQRDPSEFFNFTPSQSLIALLSNTFTFKFAVENYNLLQTFCSTVYNNKPEPVSSKLSLSKVEINTEGIAACNPINSIEIIDKSKHSGAEKNQGKTDGKVSISSSVVQNETSGHLLGKENSQYEYDSEEIVLSTWSQNQALKEKIFVGNKSDKLPLKISGSNSPKDALNKKKKCMEQTKISVSDSLTLNNKVAGKALCRSRKQKKKVNKKIKDIPIVEPIKNILKTPEAKKKSELAKSGNFSGQYSTPSNSSKRTLNSHSGINSNCSLVDGMSGVQMPNSITKLLQKVAHQKETKKAKKVQPQLTSENEFDSLCPTIGSPLGLDELVPQKVSATNEEHEVNLDDVDLVDCIVYDSQMTPLTDILNTNVVDYTLARNNLNDIIKPDISRDEIVIYDTHLGNQKQEKDPSNDKGPTQIQVNNEKIHIMENNEMYKLTNKSADLEQIKDNSDGKDTIAENECNSCDEVIPGTIEKEKTNFLLRTANQKHETSEAKICNDVNEVICEKTTKDNEVNISKPTASMQTNYIVNPSDMKTPLKANNSTLSSVSGKNSCSAKKKKGGLPDHYFVSVTPKSDESKRHSKIEGKSKKRLFDHSTSVLNSTPPLLSPQQEKDSDDKSNENEAVGMHLVLKGTDTGQEENKIKNEKKVRAKRFKAKSKVVESIDKSIKIPRRRGRPCKKPLQLKTIPKKKIPIYRCYEEESTEVSDKSSKASSIHSHHPDNTKDKYDLYSFNDSSDTSCDYNWLLKKKRKEKSVLHTYANKKPLKRSKYTSVDQSELKRKQRDSSDSSFDLLYSTPLRSTKDIKSIVTRSQAKRIAKENNKNMGTKKIELKVKQCKRSDTFVGRLHRESPEVVRGASICNSVTDLSSDAASCFHIGSPEIIKSNVGPKESCSSTKKKQMKQMLVDILSKETKCEDRNKPNQSLKLSDEDFEFPDPPNNSPDDNIFDKDNSVSMSPIYGSLKCTKLNRNVSAEFSYVSERKNLSSGASGSLTIYQKSHQENSSLKASSDDNRDLMACSQIPHYPNSNTDSEEEIGAKTLSSTYVKLSTVNYNNDNCSAPAVEEKKYLQLKNHQSSNVNKELLVDSVSSGGLVLDEELEISSAEDENEVLPPSLNQFHCTTPIRSTENTPGKLTGRNLFGDEDTQMVSIPVTIYNEVISLFERSSTLLPVLKRFKPN